MPEKLKDHVFFILFALAREDLHGHGIIRSVLEETDGEVRLWPVTLYSSLDELAERGWARELKEGDRPEGASAKRRYFRITPTGRNVLADEASRRHSIARRALRAAGR